MILNRRTIILGDNHCREKRAQSPLICRSQRRGQDEVNSNDEHIVVLGRSVGEFSTNMGVFGTCIILWIREKMGDRGVPGMSVFVTHGICPMLLLAEV